MAKTTTDTERRRFVLSELESEVEGILRAGPRHDLPALRRLQVRSGREGTCGQGIGSASHRQGGLPAPWRPEFPPAARYTKLLALPEGENIGKAVNEAMKAIEADNEELKGVLPKSYTRLGNDLLISLIKNFSQIEFSGNRRANRMT